MITIDSDYVSYIGKTENKGMENIRTEDIFYIDSSSRQIIVPDSWTAVGTLQDHLAEKVWFAVDRFFDDRDFLVDSNQIMVNYINAASEGYVYNCGEIYVWDPASNEVLEATPGTAPTGDELQRYNKVLFAWRISQNVTKKTGKITFAVRIGKFTVDIDNSEVGVDPEGQDWIWNTTIASLNVLESISSETGLDDEGNEWGIGDIARWFKSIAVAERHLTAIFNLVSGLERVAVGPKGDFTYDYYTIYPDGHYDTTSVGPVEKPPFEVDNQIQMLTTAGTLQTTACPWKYKLWINTQENPTDTLVPTINDGAPTTDDVWSSSKTSAVINATSTADRAYTDSKILSTTAAGGTTAAWATNPTTSYIQAQFGTSSATAATSGMSASGIRDYVKAQFTTTSNVSSSAGWTSSATKDYADSRIVNSPANTSTSIGLSASAVKDFMSTNYLTTADASTTYLTTADAAATYLTTADAATNYLSTAAIDDTATTAVDKVWSANKTKNYVDSNTNDEVISYADYMALTEEEKNNGTSYYIYDAQSDSKEIQPVIYSLEEREIGVWTDGKPLYQKTFLPNYVSPTHSSKDTWSVNIDVHDLSIETLAHAWGAWQRWAGDGAKLIIQFGSYEADKYEGSRIRIDSENGYTNGQLNLLMYAEGTDWQCVTIQYTKTTDTAGSGNFVPSGVPAVHYDDNEKIIGTWFGETLYEKSFYATGTFSNGTQYSIDTGILHDDLGKIVELNGNIFSTDVILPLNFYLSSNEYTRMFMAVGTTGQNASVEIYSKSFNFTKYNITIRYTKSTS